MIYHLRGDTDNDPVLICDLCQKNLSSGPKVSISQWWETEPKDNIIYSTPYKYLCLNCKKDYEINWIKHASTEQLLLAIGYDWVPQQNINNLPINGLHCESNLDLYKRRLAGEAL